MLKTILCLSAFLSLGSAAYACEDQDSLEIGGGGTFAYRESQEDMASDVLDEITQILVRCPHCPGNPKDDGKKV